MAEYFCTAMLNSLAEIIGNKKLPDYLEEKEQKGTAPNSNIFKDSKYSKRNKTNVGRFQSIESRGKGDIR